MTGILIYFLILNIGFVIGFLLKALLFRMDRYSGNIFIFKNEEKTMYSLELDEDPENLALKKEVLFRIKTSEENLIRD